MLRSLEHEHIEGMRLAGTVLDVGGGQGFRYLELLRIEGVVHSVNINSDVTPTFLADLNQPLPFADASYDHVISFNTLEHVEKDAELLAEMFRILKPGGSFLLTVPFLYRIHGSPWDFHRHTAEWWERKLVSLGIATEQFHVQPLVWSPLSSACAQFKWFRSGILGGNVKRLITLFGLLRRPQPGSSGEAELANFSLGYLIHGAKP